MRCPRYGGKDLRLGGRLIEWLHPGVRHKWGRTKYIIFKPLDPFLSNKPIQLQEHMPSGRPRKSGASSLRTPQ